MPSMALERNCARDVFGQVQLSGSFNIDLNLTFLSTTAARCEDLRSALVMLGAPLAFPEKNREHI